MKGLEGKAALVTGASGGIGRATAVDFARRGVRVAVHAFRNMEGVEETAAQVRAASSKPYDVPIVSGDLSDATVAHSVVQAAYDGLGGLDILINNAGDLIERRGLQDLTSDFFSKVLGANVHSALFCTQAAARLMLVAGSKSDVKGSIVNMGSLAAWNGGGPGSSAYATAKGAIVSLTKALAKELAPQGIRVNCVSPGLIGQTAFHAKFTKPEAFAAATQSIPLGRSGEPDDVANVITFLASEEAAFLVGETIEINGGMYLR